MIDICFRGYFRGGGGPPLCFAPPDLPFPPDSQEGATLVFSWFRPWLGKSSDFSYKEGGTKFCHFLVIGALEPFLDIISLEIFCNRMSWTFPSVFKIFTQKYFFCVQNRVQYKIYTKGIVYYESHSDSSWREN